MSKQAPEISLSQEELSQLKERIRRSDLNSEDIQTLLNLVKLIETLKTLLTKRKLSLLLWLRRIFGIKTEKFHKKDSADHKAKEENSKSGRRGRNGRDDYPGAEKTPVDHPDLKPGDPCPECKTGKLKDTHEPAVDYDWKGQAPLTVHIYLLQRLICHICKTSFTAPSPVAETAKTVDDSQDEIKVTRCDRNAGANSMVAMLRFLYGVPHYRLAKIQGKMGMGLAVGTQYRMLQQVSAAGEAVFEVLTYLAAQGSLLMADDTIMKILDWMRGQGPPNQKTGQPKKTAQTSVIISKSAEGPPITLYLTGQNQAGANMKALLGLRKPSQESPVYMCDALAANNPGEYVTIQVHCLDHGRRQFWDIKSSFPKPCEHVIQELQKVYHADKIAKERGLTPEERLKWHQEKSQPVMDNLGRWMVDQMESGKAEENSDLGRAMQYWLKRWTELTEFLHTPGVPLSNAESERAIKAVITHRKNSLFYKTENGAHVGDVIQSLMATCEGCGANVFEYLTFLQENKSKVAQNPENFLPWNFTQN